METCCVCGENMVPLIKRKDKYLLLHCPHCSFITSSPLPSEEEIRKFYDGYLFNKPSDEVVQQRDSSLLEDVKKIVADFPFYHIKKKVTLLDCGGGTGGYAQAFAKLGYNVMLIDLDVQACNYARQKYPDLFTVIAGDALQYDFKQKFDIVFCNQLIEHYPDPNSFLTRMKQLLTKDGFLIITTPNQQTKEFYFRPKWFLSYIYMVTGFKIQKMPRAIFTFLKKPWLCCDPPRHLHAFNVRNLHRLLEKNGLVPVTTLTEYSPRQYYSPAKYPDFQVHSWKDIGTLALNSYARIGVRVLQVMDTKNTRGANLVVYAQVREQGINAL